MISRCWKQGAGLEAFAAVLFKPNVGIYLREPQTSQYSLLQDCAEAPDSYPAIKPMGRSSQMGIAYNGGTLS
jgi:hypothetical protein